MQPIQLIPVSSSTSFPGDENRFPYLFSRDYLRHLRRTVPVRAWWAQSANGALLPVAVRKRKIFRIGQLLNPPLREGAELPAQEEQEFLEALIEKLRRTGTCDRLAQPTTNCVFQSAPRHATTCPFGSYRLTLRDRTEDEIFATFHADYRNKIRAAIRQGAEVRFGRDQLPIFHQLHAATMTQTGMPHESLDAMSELYDVLAPTDRVLCAVVYHENRPLGGVFVPWTRHSGHYTHGGSGEDVHPVGAVRLLHWEVIRKLHAQGVGYYDFVGARLSSVEGTKLEFIQRFKARFGTELVRGQMWKCDVNPWKARLYDSLVKLRRVLPGGSPPGTGDIIDQELRKFAAPSAESAASA